MPLLECAKPAGRFPALDGLSWHTDPLSACSFVAELLKEDVTILRQFAIWVSDIAPRQMRKILNRSVEKSTHYKWFIGERSSDYSVWLHQYRPAEVFSTSDRFAASVHDHRYPFVSRVLSGSLGVSTFEVSSRDEVTYAIRLVGQRVFEVGDVMFLTADDVHRIDRVRDDTMTIVVQGPPARHYSTRFDPSSGCAERIYDLDALFPKLASAFTNYDYFAARTLT